MEAEGMCENRSGEVMHSQQAEEDRKAIFRCARGLCATESHILLQMVASYQ
jgi:hypothetical protein